MLSDEIKEPTIERFNELDLSGAVNNYYHFMLGQLSVSDPEAKVSGDDLALTASIRVMAEALAENTGSEFSAEDIFHAAQQDETVQDELRELIIEAVQTRQPVDKVASLSDEEQPTEVVEGNIHEA